ncbi:MAG: aspartate kinase [Elusimicrobiota bacterium]|nr:aspartate kinase [Elusimicrobiota bacterium]
MSKKNIVVQKYGGTSVGDAAKIKRVASRIIRKKESGKSVVVVVSAPGDTTDRLIEMAGSISPNPEIRELDMLLATGEQQGIALVAMAIHEQGHNAISLTGHQVGIMTDSAHSRARIKSINTKKLKKELARDNIVIVAGFQGISVEENITTLGRGGSDLSAVALATVLDAEACEIYTDVDGVYNTDPSVVPEAKKIDKISYDEMLEFASAGARVLQSRSVEVAKKNNVKVVIKSSYIEEEKNSGTIIMKETKDLEQVAVRGVTLDKNQARMSIVGVPDRPGIAAKIFGDLAKENINVDMIIQSSAHETGINDISFTVNHEMLKKAVEICSRIKGELGATGIITDENVAKISIIGIGMRSHAGVAAKMFELLSDNDINIEMISTSEIKISCVIDAKEGKSAVKILHKEFCR